MVRLHNRGDPITNYAPLISTCATYFLLIALNILPHRWHQHVVYVRTISVTVLGACLFWFLQVDMSYQISDANTMAIASSPVCSDAEVARMHDEVVRMLRERLEVEIVRHHVTLARMLGSCYLTVTCVTFGWCKTVFLAVVSFLSTAIVWQVFNPFVPVSKHANKIGAAVGLLFLLPIALAMAVTTERRKVLLTNFLRGQDRAHSQEADSILHHTVKNTMADSAGQLEIFLDDPDGIKDLDPRLIQNLKMALASLRRGMKSCRNRQTYISLVSGTYNSVRSAVTAHQFLSDVTMGRAVEVVETQLGEFQLDPVLMDLILHSAMANATKHGDPRGPKVRITVKAGRMEARCSRSPTRQTQTAKF